MKKKFLFPLFLLLLCLFSGAANAETGKASGQLGTGEAILTEENRYNPIYYQEPEERYPAGSASKGRAAELSLEDCVVNALEQLQPSIDVSSYNIFTSEAGEVFFQILNNHPSLFFVKSSISYSYISNQVLSYNVKYLGTEEEIQFQRAAFRQEVQKALTWAASSSGTAERALAVHDYLVLECEYDYESYLNENVPDISHTAYGALVGKTAVCDGYAKAYACILAELGIESKIVSSDSMNHAWNLVSVDGDWYHADATWDDPTWDSIGRVSHRYFLLSDTAISAVEHEGWESNGTVAGSTTYDNAFWSDVNSAIINYGGNWYYSKYDGTAPSVSLMKKSGSLDAQEETVYSTAVWSSSGGGYYTGSFMYLDWEPRKDEVYFNTPDSIYKLDANGNTSEVYQPELPQGSQIYGFTVRGASLCYALQETPNINEKQAVEEYILESLQLKPLEGISADNVDPVYDGSAKVILLKGIQPGDVVSFFANGIYGPKQPEMINAGTYQVLYKVAREGYEDFLGSAQITIQKAKPEPALPTGLKGNSGNRLSSVTLPEGFTWENASEKLKETGDKTFYVIYTPEDTQNYETLSHIAVTITVNCPNHNYTGTVTVQPTTTEKGEKTYTCSLCGHTYTEAIPMLGSGNTGSTGDSNKDPENPGGGTGGSGSTGTTGGTGGSGNTGTTGGTGGSGTVSPAKPKKVSGLKLGKATATSLKVSWKPIQGEKYRVVLYKGAKAVSTKYTGNSTYTFKNLKNATQYTVKVTSYVEKKGKKVYAPSAATLKTATAPAKVKLISIKKMGSAKVKLIWKKVTRADGYEISMRTGKEKYKVIRNIARGKTVTYTKAGLRKGKRYTFRVRAYKKAGSKKIYGGYSSLKFVTIR